MTRLKEENINTKEWWDSQHSDGSPHNQKIWDQFCRFFTMGYLPTDRSISVLDVGCGQALHFNDIHKTYPNVKMFGLDISKVVIEKNLQVAPHGEYLEIDINTQEIPGIYDFVVSMHTFEHFENPIEAVEKCRKVAREKVVVLVPNDHHWSGDRSHVHKFTPEEPFSGYVEAKVIDGLYGAEQELVFVFEGKAR